MNQAQSVPEGHVVRKKWWKPLDETQKALFDTMKHEIHTFLTVSQEGVPATEFEREFKEVTCVDIEVNDIGFGNIYELLYHLDDIVTLRKDINYGTLFIYVNSWAAVHKEIGHIRSMVLAQGMSDRTKTMSKRGMKGLRSNTREVEIEELLNIECVGKYPGDSGKSSEAQASFSYQNRTQSHDNRASVGQRYGKKRNFSKWRDNRPRATYEATGPIPDDTPKPGIWKVLGLTPDEEK